MHFPTKAIGRANALTTQWKRGLDKNSIWNLKLLG
jgi:hypothetical protein